MNMAKIGINIATGSLQQREIIHARDDMQTRALLEVRTEAKHLVEITERFLEKNSTFLTGMEKEITDSAIHELKKVLELDDKDLIHQKIESLNEASRSYAERLMNQAITKTMKGKVI